MANAFKQKQDQAKLSKLLSDCATQFTSGGPVSRQRAIAAYAQGAGVSNVVAERTLSDRARLWRSE